jgi:hypothetical protein
MQRRREKGGVRSEGGGRGVTPLPLHCTTYYYCTCTATTTATCFCYCNTIILLPPLLLNHYDHTAYYSVMTVPPVKPEERERGRGGSRERATSTSIVYGFRSSRYKGGAFHSERTVRGCGFLLGP